MTRKLLSLIALLALGGTLAAWCYAGEDGNQSAASGSRYAEPPRFEPPATGSLTGQLQAATQTVTSEHGTAPVAGQIQQTGGLDWLLERKRSNQSDQPPVEQIREIQQQEAATPPPIATRPRRGPAPVTVDMNAAKAYRNSAKPRSETPSSTATGTTTTQFRPVQARTLAPPTEPRVASRPLPGSQAAEAPAELDASQPETAPAQLTAPQPLAPMPIEQEAEAIEISTPSLSDIQPRTAPEPEGTAVLSAVSPQLGLAVVGPQAVVLGRETEYVVHVQNGGNTAAGQVEVSIVLPSWVKILATDANSGVARVDDQTIGSLHWTINGLAVDDSTQLSIQVAALEARPITLDVRYAAAPTVAAASIAVQQPKLEVSLNGPSEIPYGEARQFTLSINNPGTGNAENVILQLQPLSRNLEAGVTKELGTLKAGERKAIEIELTAEEAGQLAVQAAVTAAGGLKAETRLDVHVRRAQLALEVAGPPQKFAGAEAVFQMKISNTGDATANDVLLAAVLPAGAEVLDVTEGATEETGNIGWNVGSLAPGDARIYRVICSLTKPGQNEVEVRAKSATGMAAGKSIRTLVEAIADLKLLVNDPKGPIAVGKDADYEIRIVNRGSKAAENVNVKGYFSEGIEPETVDGGIGKLEIGQAIFDPISRIEAGEEIVLKIKARASAGGNHIFRAVVECEKPETRLVSEETTRYFETTANAFGDTISR
jgi:hypothetical protein